LGTHPCCMVPESGMSFEMEKYFRRMNPEMAMDGGRILEVNPAHPVLEKIKTLTDTDKDTAHRLAELLYSQACIMADLPLEDPTAYTDLVCSFITE
ncbi:MAG: molecular chaperone HtpG, partial [Clostridia bacterium]|nr:molecular chaperone HtpG [Clostridia bacterium]